MGGSSSDSASGRKGARSPARRCCGVRGDEEEGRVSPNTGVLAHHTKILLRLALLLQSLPWPPLPLAQRPSTLAPLLNQASADPQPLGLGSAALDVPLLRAFKASGPRELCVAGAHTACCGF